MSMELLAGLGFGLILFIILAIMIYPVFKVMPTIYAATKVRALRAKLFSLDEIHSFVHKDYKTIIHNIEKKGYPHLLESINKDFAEDKIQRILKTQDSKELKDILVSLKGKHKVFFKTLLEKKDIDFVIALFRTKASPKFEQYALKDLLVQRKNVTQKDIDIIVKSNTEELIHYFKKTRFNKYISQYTQNITNGNIADVENKLYDTYYHRLLQLAESEESLKQYVKEEIDVQNIRRALCFSKTTFIKNGNLDSKTLDKCDKAESVEEIIIALQHSKYHPYIKESKHITDVLKSLNRYKLDFAKNLMVKEPLQIGQVMAYYIQKRIELKNIRLLLKLKHANFSQEDIKEAII